MQTTFMPLICPCDIIHISTRRYYKETYPQGLQKNISAFYSLYSTIFYTFAVKILANDAETITSLPQRNKKANTINENKNYMEDGERKIQGYLECDGSIVRISSLEDIKNFITKYGKTVNEISDLELEELTNQKYYANDCITDDCGVTYKNNPLVLLSRPYRRDIENYKIKEGTVAIASGAFLPDTTTWELTRLRNILFPDSLIAIGDYAFFNCNIGQLKFPDSLKHIGTLAFYWNKIKSISFPKNILSIGDSAFGECKELERIEFNGLPMSIGDGAFCGCTALKEIVIPQGSSDFFEEELFPISRELFIEKDS